MSKAETHTHRCRPTIDIHSIHVQYRCTLYTAHMHNTYIHSIHVQYRCTQHTCTIQMYIVHSTHAQYIYTQHTCTIQMYTAYMYDTDIHSIHQCIYRSYTYMHTYIHTH